MSRPHPFDFAFGAVADTWFAEIRDEAAAARLEVADVSAFLRLASVQRILGELAGEPGGAGDSFLPLLYAGFHFWSTGRTTVPVERAALEATLDGQPERWPREARYVQFPERWLWSQVQDGAPHEPVDGLFVVPGSREIVVTAILGFRPDREGLSQVTAAATPAAFADAVRTAPTPRFAPAMDGGVVAGFRSVRSNLELLLLASLALGVARE